METTNHKLFLELYSPVHSQLSRFCRAISGNREDAEDLMNDTILAMLQNMNRLKEESAFKSYIFQIASNLNRMRFRRMKFHADFNEQEISQLSDMQVNPEISADFSIIYEKIHALPSRTAETLILFHISDLSLEEIQKIQGGSLSGVKLRLKRGRDKLLQSLNTPTQKTLAWMFFTF